MTPIRMAPWPDFAGNPIHEGDIIEHPSHERGRVVFKHDGETIWRQWRVHYDETPDGDFSLGSQVSERGEAVVVHSAVRGKIYLKPCPFCKSTKLRFDTEELCREDPDALSSVVICDDCGCHGPTEQEQWEDTKEAAERRAADRWNGRKERAE